MKILERGSTSSVKWSALETLLSNIKVIFEIRLCKTKTVMALKREVC